jgi:hypothetical protein
MSAPTPKINGSVTATAKATQSSSPVHDLPIEISAEHRHLTLCEIDRVIGGSLGDGDLLN